MYVCMYMYLSVRSLSSEGVGRRESGHLGVDVERTMLPERERRKSIQKLKQCGGQLSLLSVSSAEETNG